MRVLLQSKAQEIVRQSATSIAKLKDVLHTSILYYELLQPDETVTANRYQQKRLQLRNQLRVKTPERASRYDKLIFLLMTTQRRKKVTKIEMGDATPPPADTASSLVAALSNKHNI